MADILTDKQVKDCELSIKAYGSLNGDDGLDLIATLRHVQAERYKADKDKEYWRELSISQREDADAEVESLQADSERLQQENARLREALVRIANSDDEWYFGKTSMRAVARQALATEGEEKDEPTIPRP